MSRSKREPYATEGYGSKDKPRRKRAASRAVRKADIASGSAYKKAYPSWDITDFKFYSPETPKMRRK